MKFTGFTLSVALAGVVSAAALPTIPGSSIVSGAENIAEGALAGLKRDGGEAVSGIENIAKGALAGLKRDGGEAVSGIENIAKGALAGLKRDGGEAVSGIENIAKGALAGLKRDGGDAVSGLVYGVTGMTNGATGIVGSAAGTAESTSSGLVGTAESTISGAIPAKRQLGGLEDAVKNTISGLKRDDALTGLVYGVTESTNGATGIVGSAAGTAESTSSGLVGTAESTVSGAVPAKRQLGEVEDTVEDSLAGLKRDGGDAVTGLVYGVTQSTNGATGIAGSAAGTAENTSSGLVGTAESTAAGAVPAKRQLPGAGNIVKASVQNDLAMLSGNPSGLIGALGGLQAALATGGILPSQISSLPAELQLVVGYLYTA